MVRVGGPELWARDVMRLSGPFAPCLGRRGEHAAPAH